MKRAIGSRVMVLAAAAACTVGAPGAGCRSTPAASGPPSSDAARPEATRPPAPPPTTSPQRPPAPPAPDPLTWRPSWWIDSALVTAKAATACAMADDADLAVARRRAIDGAVSALRDAMGRDPSDTDLTVDSIRLPDGRYRAFVLAAARSE
jgi:hypothetical protein